MSQNDTDDISLVLAARAYAYEALRCLFGDEPSAELLKVIVGGDFRQAALVVLGDDAEGASALDALIDEAAVAGLDRLKSDYMRALIGPGKLPAYPWESMNLEGQDKTLFADCTLAVRRAYRAYGLQSQKLGSEPDDHLSLELHFMAHLAQDALEDWRDDHPGMCAGCLEVSATFLDEHLNLWLPAYAADFCDRAPENFYCRAATLACHLAQADRTLLPELLAEVRES